jgi:hypothetical protein
MLPREGYILQGGSSENQVIEFQRMYYRITKHSSEPPKQCRRQTYQNHSGLPSHPHLPRHGEDILKLQCDGCPGHPSSRDPVQTDQDLQQAHGH